MGRLQKSSCCRRSLAFTTMEFTIVAVILGIIAAAVIIKLPGRVVNLSFQIDQLVSDLRYTNNLAMTRGARYKLAKTSSNSYQISSVGTNPIVVIKTVTLETPIIFAGFPNNMVVFDGKGVPYSTDTVPGTPLSATLEIKLDANGHHKSVFVTPETGRISP